MGSISSSRINDHIIKINEYGEGVNVDSYLVLGKSKAIVIDTLQDNTELYDEVRKYTDLPLQVIITHGHPDHAGKSCNKFSEHNIPIYMHENDKDLLNSFTSDNWTKTIRDINNIDIFDLDGIKLEIITCFGHTKGSIVLLDRDNQELYSGDAIGSGGFWMQLDHCLPLSSYLPNVKNLYNIVLQYPNLKIYLGHSGQSSIIPDITYIKDNIEATQMIINGKLIGEKQTMNLGDTPLQFWCANYKQIFAYCYNKDNI